MSSFVQKATPFFEHIVIGGAFAAVGYLFFWTFSASFLSVLGMVAVCFGGLKILIGSIIYGIWLFALIFRPDYLKKKEEEEKEAERKKKEIAIEESARPGNWFQKNTPFVVKHWGTLLEISILVTGFVIVVVIRQDL